MPDPYRPPTRNDVVRLLAIAAGGDQRTVGEDDADLWFAIAIEERWHIAAARRIIIKHYGSGADRPRLTPAAITDRLRALRNQAADTFELPCIPDQVPAEQYPAWLRAQRDHHVGALLDQWATTGQDMPRSSAAAAVEVRSLDELIARAPIEVQGPLTAGSSRLERRSVDRG